MLPVARLEIHLSDDDLQQLDRAFRPPSRKFLFRSS